MIHRILNTHEACALLHVSRSTFLRLQAAWTPASPVPFPDPIRVTPRRFYWDEADLLRWQRDHRHWRYAGIFTGPATELITSRQIALELKISPARLLTYRHAGQFPPARDRVGRNLLWIRSDIRKWVTTTEVISQWDLLPKKIDWQ